MCPKTFQTLCLASSNKRARVALPGVRVTIAVLDQPIHYVKVVISPKLGLFDGVVACSELTMVATRLAQTYKPIKRVIIFCGVTPPDKSMTDSNFTPTVDAERIPGHIPHIFAVNDMFKLSASIIHSYYDQDKAPMLLHLKGHAIPMDLKNQKEIRKGIAGFLVSVYLHPVRN